jgi:hypothetical protein
MRDDKRDVDAACEQHLDTADADIVVGENDCAHFV